MVVACIGSLAGLPSRATRPVAFVGPRCRCCLHEWCSLLSNRSQLRVDSITSFCAQNVTLKIKGAERWSSGGGLSAHKWLPRCLISNRQSEARSENPRGTLPLGTYLDSRMSAANSDTLHSAICRRSPAYCWRHGRREYPHLYLKKGFQLMRTTPGAILAWATPLPDLGPLVGIGPLPEYGKAGSVPPWTPHWPYPVLGS